MRILYVCPYYKPAYVYGGPTQCFSDACEGLVHSGIQVTVLTTNANGPELLDVPLQQPVDVDGVTVWYFPLFLNGLTFFYSPELARAIKKQVPEHDLVVVAALWAHQLIPTAAACVRANVPYVIPTHGQLFPWALARKSLKKKVYLELLARHRINRAAAIQCTDPSEADAVAKFMFLPPAFVVPNAISTSLFDTPRTQSFLRKRFGISIGASILIFLGRLTHIKRPDIAVDVLGAAQSLEHEVHLVIVGPDEDGLTNRLQAQAQELGCADKLHFTGLLGREAVVSALADADLLLMPSEITENFGIAALEAMAAGVPILVSEGIPVGKWAVRADAGRMVQATTKAFAHHACAMLRDTGELRQMGLRGRAYATQHFDISQVTHQLLSAYQSIVENGYPVEAPSTGLVEHSY